MEKITGKQIYQCGELAVNQHPDGYIISNGVRFLVRDEMPSLSPEALRRLLAGPTGEPSRHAQTVQRRRMRSRVVTGGRQLLEAFLTQADDAVALMALGY